MKIREEHWKEVVQSRGGHTTKKAANKFLPDVGNILNNVLVLAKSPYRGKTLVPWLFRAPAPAPSPFPVAPTAPGTRGPNSVGCPFCITGNVVTPQAVQVLKVRKRSFPNNLLSQVRRDGSPLLNHIRPSSPTLLLPL